MPTKSPTTIAKTVAAYLDTISLARSQNTGRTYRNALNEFILVLQKRHLPVETTAIEALHEDAITWLAEHLKDRAPTTERLYLTAVAGFYEYLAAEELTEINLPRLRLLIRQRARKPGQRLPQFPRNSIDQIISFVNNFTNFPSEDGNPRLRALRDRAFLITLADTGLRVHEACGLRRGDLDWNEGRAIIIGKGNKEAVVRFSARSMAALKVYLKARAILDGGTGKPLSSLPLFARHDDGAGKQIKPVSTKTGRLIVAEWVEKILGSDAVGTITPHSFRHYFVTRVLQSSGNLKLAQELARHSNIAVTQRYAHLSDDELDKGYMEAIEA